jgi:hypothetical protein
VPESAIGPQRRFTAVQGMSPMEGKPDGRRTRPEPLFLTRSRHRSEDRGEDIANLSMVR